MEYHFTPTFIKFFNGITIEKTESNPPNEKISWILSFACPFYWRRVRKLSLTLPVTVDTPAFGVLLLLCFKFDHSRFDSLLIFVLVDIFTDKPCPLHWAIVLFSIKKILNPFLLINSIRQFSTAWFWQLVVLNVVFLLLYKLWLLPFIVQVYGLDLLFDCWLRKDRCWLLSLW